MEGLLLGIGLHKKLYGETESALEVAMFAGTLFSVEDEEEEAKYSE